MLFGVCCPPPLWGPSHSSGKSLLVVPSSVPKCSTKYCNPHSANFIAAWLFLASPNTHTNTKALWLNNTLLLCRVAEVGSLSARAKMAIQIFVGRVFATFSKCVFFARNCKLANSIQYNMQYIPCALLAHETLHYRLRWPFGVLKHKKVLKHMLISCSF